MALAGAVLLLLAGFWRYTDPRRSSESHERIIIRFWNGFTGPDGRSISRLADQFNAENPDVKVLVQRIEWNTYYNKLFVAGMGGRTPEVFVLHATMLPRIMGAGFAAPFEDPGLPLDDFDARILDTVFQHGKLWAVPLDVFPMGMYCNLELFREAGITNATGEVAIPRNRVQLLDAMHRLTKDTDGDGKTDQWGFVITATRMNYQSVMAQMGGRILSEDGRQCLVDSPENIAALDFFVDLVEKEKVCPKPEGFDSWVGFRQGKVGMVFEGPWMVPELEKSGLDYYGAAFPVIGDRPGVWVDSHVLCLSNEADGARKNAALRFIRFLSDHSLAWSSNGPLPARKSLRSTEAFRQMQTQEEFSRMIPYLQYSPMVPFKLELDIELDIAVERALRRSASSSEALHDAAAKIWTIMERNRHEEAKHGQ